MSFVLRKAGHFAYQAALVIILVWMATCSVRLREKSNWEKTTGSIGETGMTDTKSSASITVYYKDPATGSDKSADMHVPNDRAQAIVNSSQAEQAAYIYNNIFGKTTVCLESVWDECCDEATPKWYFFVLVIGLLGVSVGYLYKDYRAEKAHPR